VELDIREADTELARGAELLGALLRTDEAELTREEDERGVELVIWEELERGVKYSRKEKHTRRAAGTSTRHAAGARTRQRAAARMNRGRRAAGAHARPAGGDQARRRAA
jgi:hypothetical protein